jgi:hypothetical protein
MDGGQYGVSIYDSAGVFGKFRYFLFVASRTEKDDDFGNTFFSELDIIDGSAKELPKPIVLQSAPDLSRTFMAGNGKYQIKIDPSRAPDLADWAFRDLAPVVQEWYPKIVGLLPGKNFEAAEKLTIDFGNKNQGFTAITRGNHITCTTDWFREELHKEAIGCVIHELVHVVQAYNRSSANGTRHKNSVPNWLGEGIPDYIRWFIYEPQSHGADIVWMRQQANFTPRYNDSYRVSANFLDWATQNYEPDLVSKLNVALREGKYNDDLWVKLTGRKLRQLGDDWKSRRIREIKSP